MATSCINIIRTDEKSELCANRSHIQILSLYFCGPIRRLIILNPQFFQLGSQRILASFVETRERRLRGAKVLAEKGHDFLRAKRIFKTYVIPCERQLRDALREALANRCLISPQHRRCKSGRGRRYFCGDLKRSAYKALRGPIPHRN